ncbi:MAG: magnesium chelatase [bacterium]
MRSYTSLVRHEGNKELFFFTELGVIGLAAGMPVHLHAEGLRGTGKTTILRSARSILPTVVRIKDCQFNCDPGNPHCPSHSYLTAEEKATLEREKVNTPYLEISHSAKIGTVVGSLDLKQLTNVDHPEAALLPGILPRAHRGIVLVDEINRLADTAPELTDILLDAMGTKPGRVQIEENGLPTVSLPLRASIWAASNPDEDPGSLADIRRQLSDRFDFMVHMGRPREVASLLEILNPDQSSVRFDREQKADDRLSQRLVEMASRVPIIEIPDVILESLAEIYLNHNLESLRALEAVKTGAVLATARRGGYEVTWDDVLMVAPAALRHRLNPEQLETVLQDLQRERNLLESPAWAAASGATSALLEQDQPLSAGKSSSSMKNQRVGWWERVVTWCSQLMGRRRDVFQSSEGKSKVANLGQGKRVRTKQSSVPKMSNPLDMPLVTPPSTARPLFELEVADAVAVGEVTDGSKH